jgi:hypothetical protein
MAGPADDPQVGDLQAGGGGGQFGFGGQVADQGHALGPGHDGPPWDSADPTIAAPAHAGTGVGTLAASMSIQETEVVSVEAVAPLVALVALPVSIALFGWLIYRLLRPGGRR